jgi:hypothetical protein
MSNIREFPEERIWQAMAKQLSNLDGYWFCDNYHYIKSAFLSAWNNEMHAPAVKWFKSIPEEGINREKYTEDNLIGRGEIAEKLWHDTNFSLGYEFGVKHALIELFGLTNIGIWGRDRK